MYIFLVIVRSGFKEKSIYLGRWKKGKNLQAVAAKQREVFGGPNISAEQKWAGGKKKEWINHLLLHGVRISENITWLQRHSVLRRQLHITDTYTKYLSGSNSVDWSNTNINVGLTWNLCLRSASIQAHVLHLKNLPRLFQKKYINPRAV